MCDRGAGYCTGGRLEAFERGWAVAMFRGSKAHYFVREQLAEAHSICESVTGVPAGHLFGPGNFPRCQRCVRRAAWIEAK